MTEHDQNTTAVDVLVVDDTDSNLRLLEFILKDAGYCVACASSGEQAIQQALAVQPQLILLDVMMPGMSGFEACQRLKTLEATKQIPIIFITARASEDDETKSFQLGAVDYILKPISEPVVLARVKTHLELKKHQENLEHLVNQRTDALNLTLRELAKSNQVKDEFLAIISHEMRTPINGIKGCMELLQFTELNNTQKDLVTQSQQSTDELCGIVENILVLTEAIAGSLKLNQHSFKLPALVQAVCEQYAAAVRLKGLDFTLHIGDELPELCYGDPVQIGRILSHLIANAVKFTLQGQITVSVNLDGGQQLVFTVTDSGIGIDDQQQQIIFDLFQQADMAFNRRFGGLGIGLPICHFLSQCMAGRLSFESHSGQGSSFSFELPLLPAATEQRVGSQQQSRRKPVKTPYSVLIVEDNTVNLMIQRAIVEKLGYQVYTAANGEQALQFLAEHEVDLILMDCQMPIMDGFEATRSIRQGNDKLNDIPIIAVTANATSLDRNRCIRAGMDDHIAKPIDMPKLSSVLKQWLGRPDKDSANKDKPED